jgi:hypothetical protein
LAASRQKDAGEILTLPDNYDGLQSHLDDRARLPP